MPFFMVDDAMCESLTIDWPLVATIGIPALIVVVGWFIAHWLNVSRDLASRKREARIKALEAAYMRVANSCNRPLTEKLNDDLETFVAELQLYGTPHQIQLMSVIAEGLAKPNNIVSYDDILVDLRNTIRKELNLEPLQGAVWWLRLNREPTGSVNPSLNPPDAPTNGATVS